MFSCVFHRRKNSSTVSLAESPLQADILLHRSRTRLQLAFVGVLVPWYEDDRQDTVHVRAYAQLFSPRGPASRIETFFKLSVYGLRESKSRGPVALREEAGPQVLSFGSSRAPRSAGGASWQLNEELTVLLSSKDGLHFSASVVSVIRLTLGSVWQPGRVQRVWTRLELRVIALGAC